MDFFFWLFCHWTLPLFHNSIINRIRTWPCQNNSHTIMPHRAKLNSATSFKWFNFKEAVVPLSGWAWLVGPPISRPRRGWVISTRHRRRIGEPIGKACKNYYPIPLYFTDQYYCTHTLGCHLASCSSCIGSRLVDELPTMVGPYTLAKLLADILHSVQCETLKRKQDKREVTESCGKSTKWCQTVYFR